MGLRVDYRVDERTDYVKSTHAAARYLRELYRKYGDWLLVIAAYNGGPGRVESAIARSGSRNFWDLQYYLPEESRNHVKKFIGTHYIFEGSGGQTTSTKDEWVKNQQNTFGSAQSLRQQLTPEDIANTTTHTIIGRYNSVVVSNHLSMDITEFNRLNPHFDKLVNADSGYLIRLPPEKMDLFNANRHIILYQSLMANMHSAKQAAQGFTTPSPAQKPNTPTVGPRRNR
ncbi:MAG TPA: transglycosylase SLT domain-containing protein, partial [Phnomibacter sp.]|nr:transglycosylase SLT domain-containing protein [Phnomibacter sp.]